MKRKYDFLIVDFMVEDSHRVYCNALVNSINMQCSSIVIEKKGYIDYLQDENHKIFGISTREIVGNYPIKARINTMYNYKTAIKIAEKYDFKKIVVLGYDPVMFSFMYRKLCNMGDVYLVEHHQLDEVSSSRWKYKLWNLYKLHTRHILLDDSITTITSEFFNIPKEKLYVFPHPCIFNESVRIKSRSEISTIKVLCISQSNDIKQMQALVKYEHKTRFFEKNNIKIVIRKNSNWNTDGLLGFETVEGFLSTEEYNQLNEECDIVLMPFPLDYKYRCSGTLIDALAAGKKVISSDIPESKAYSERFTSICRTYKLIEEIGHIILALNDTESDMEKSSFFSYQYEMKKKGEIDICGAYND